MQTPEDVTVTLLLFSEAIDQALVVLLWCLALRVALSCSGPVWELLLTLAKSLKTLVFMSVLITTALVCWKPLSIAWSAYLTTVQLFQHTSSFVPVYVFPEPSSTLVVT